MSRPCAACARCGIDPSDDTDLICHHPTTGSPFGKYIRRMREPSAACGPDATLFEQHPLRHEDGSLKR